MPKAHKSSAKGSRQAPSQEVENIPSSQEELSSSDQEDPEVSFRPDFPVQPTTRQGQQSQPVTSMYMDWTVNDGLYHRFLKR